MIVQPIRTTETDGFVIHNARVVTPERVLHDASVHVENGMIHKIMTTNGRPKANKDVDAAGRILMPGFIDIHSDVIETAIEPRPGGRFPEDVALHELDKQLVACGVTTIFHCLCFLPSDETPSFRNAETTDLLISRIHEFQHDLKARTYVHARYEVTNNEDFETVEALIQNKRIHYFSIMDHTPGQGQFSRLDNFRSYYSKTRKLSSSLMEEMIERRLAAGKCIDWSSLKKMAHLCRENAIQIASHDDDSAYKVKFVKELGVSLAEFPVNMEAARTARDEGMYISLGAPNVLRGKSLTGNLSARDAVINGLGDVICSDYAPMTLLHAMMVLYRKGLMPFCDAVRLITLNPAKAVGLEKQTGSIEPGKRADLVLVDERRKVPAIVRTWVNGLDVYNAGAC